MTIAYSNRNGRGLLSRFRRSQTWLEISGYHVGDVQSDDPVAILDGATMVGNIFAPVVSINGLLYGAAVAQQTIIEAAGQVWSDVYTISLHIEPGGKIQGWVSTLDEASFAALAQGNSLEDPTAVSLPDSAPDGSRLVRSDTEIDTMRLLQAEAATALAARSELEQTFEMRLAEIAGETSEKVVTLDKSLSETQTTLRTTTQQLEEITVQLHSREQEGEQQAHELGIARELLAEQLDELEQLKQAHEQNLLEFEQLQTVKTAVDQDLQTARDDIETLNDRVHSLETALQASLQHTAELEESLVRWQELAETTENQANELSRQLDTVQFDLGEKERMVEMLRGQRQQAEDDWQSTTKTLRGLEEELAAYQAHNQQLEEALDTTRAEGEENAQLVVALTEKTAALEKDITDKDSQLASQSQELVDISNARKAATSIADEKERAIVTLQQENSAQVRELKQQLSTKEADFTQRYTALENENTRQMATMESNYLQQIATQKKELDARRVALEQDRDQKIAAIQDESQRLINSQKQDYDRKLISVEQDMGRQISSLQNEMHKLQNVKNELSTTSQDQITTASAQIEQLQESLTTTNKKLHANEEQLTWHKANLQSTQRELENYRQKSEDQSTAVTSLRKKAGAQQKQIAQLQRAAKDDEQRLQTQQARLVNMKKELKVIHQEAVREKKELQEKMRHIQLQLTANEEELEQHLQATSKQGRHLAEIQSILIERELQLQQAQAKIQKQSEFIQQMKQVTTERIDALKGQLSQARNLLQQRQK